MSEFTPWLGLCHLRRVSDESPAPQPTLVAVRANSAETFEREVHVYTNSHGLQMIWTEDVMPATDWQDKHPARKDGARLAGKVSAKHLVEIGGIGAGTTGPGTDGAPDGEAGGYLHIEEIEIPGFPDQSDLPFWEQSWVVPELKELLFGQADKRKEILRTYFIVDSTLRKNIKGVFDLDTLDVPVRCLFKGDAAETMKEAAPYLVDMTLPDDAWEDNDKVPLFHKDFFANHWGKNTGIFVCTTAPIDEVWTHFRKFTKVQIEEDKRWVFFRFWDPKVLPDYLLNIRNNPEKAGAFCTTKNGMPYIFYIVKNACLIKVEPNMEQLNSISRKTFVLHYSDFSSISEKKKEQRERRISEKIKADFSAELSNRNIEDIHASVTSSIQRFSAFGFQTQEKLHFLAAWGVFYGDRYEEKDPDGILLQICRMDLPEDKKFKQFKDRIESLRTKDEETT